MVQHHASPADASIMLQLFEPKHDLRLRQASNFCVLGLWPRSAEDVLRALPAFATPVDSDLRQADGGHIRVRRAAHGFTMIELVIVTAIILVVAAVAIPAVMTATYNLRLRSSGSEVAGLLQSARMRAIRDNRTYPLNCAPQPVNNCITLYVDLSGTGNGAYQAGAAVVELPGTVRFSTAGFPAIPQATLGFVPSVSQQIYFNPRGLPCSLGGGGICTNNGFVLYFQDQRALGTNGYGAVAITPAGRIRVYSYNVSRGWYQS